MVLVGPVTASIPSSQTTTKTPMKIRPFPMTFAFLYRQNVIVNNTFLYRREAGGAVRPVTASIIYRRLGSLMRAWYHIERSVAGLPMNFFWIEYHQIRFISFGIWFLGLFLTDFTAIVNAPDDGWRDVLQYLKVISIIHIIFLISFLIYLLYRHWAAVESEAPSWKMIVQSMFDMSLHLDIAAIIFSSYFKQEPKLAMIVPEVLIVLDVVLTLALTPFKRWRALIDIFGVLPTVVLGHVSLFKEMNYLFVFLPISIVLLCPLIFTIIVIGFSRTVSRGDGSSVDRDSFAMKMITKIDPSLLPNKMMIPLNRMTLESTDQSATASIAGRRDGPPSIQERATSGEGSAETDYFDFKSIPAAVAASFFIHFGTFASGSHSNTMVVMAHYFLMLAAFLVNTRVVAFPAIILTNVVNHDVQFNSVWPELSFV